MYIDKLNNLYEQVYSVDFKIQNKLNPIRIVCTCVAKILRKLILTRVYDIDIPISTIGHSNIVVSITTFPQRFSSLKYTIISILRQSVKPERIIINLTKKECPNGLNDIPEELKCLQKYGVVYEFRDEFLKPHGKYYYTLQEYRNKLVITFDDDIFYRNSAIEELLELHQANPECVCARLVRKIEYEKGVNKPYNEWPVYNNNVKGHEFVALGFGGVLYPAYLFNDSNLFNLDDIKKLALNADDLWLKVNEVLLNIPVVTGKFKAPDVDLATGSVSALSADNVAKSRNDMQWDALDEAYDINKKILKQLSSV